MSNQVFENQTVQFGKQYQTFSTTLGGSAPNVPITFTIWNDGLNINVMTVATTQFVTSSTSAIIQCADAFPIPCRPSVPMYGRYIFQASNMLVAYIGGIAQLNSNGILTFYTTDTGSGWINGSTVNIPEIIISFPIS